VTRLRGRGGGSRRCSDHAGGGKSGKSSSHDAPLYLETVKGPECASPLLPNQRPAERKVAENQVNSA
jgi:hypothetical protein